MSEQADYGFTPSGRRRQWPDWSDPERYYGFSAPTNGGKHFHRLTTLYFIRSGEFVKIGIANDLAARLLAFEAGNPLGISVAAYRNVPRPLARQIEKMMHVHYADRAIGREWFRDLDVAEAIKVLTPVIRRAKAAVKNWKADGYARIMDG